jgi:hypothetical protein
MTLPAFSAQQTLSAENADCALTVTLAFPTPDAVQLHYHVQNRSVLALYLLNQLWQTITNQDQAVVPPNRANIEVLADQVKISQEVPEIPFGMLLEVPYMPLMVRIEPGADYAKTLTLPLPLIPYTRYESTPAPGPLLTRPLHVELGYILGHPHVESVLRQLQTTTREPVFAIPHFPASYQSTIGVGPFQEALAVVSLLNPPPTKPASTGEWTPWG